MREKRAIATLGLFWRCRRSFSQALLGGILLSALVAALLPNRYESRVSLVPSLGVPESQFLHSTTIQDALIRKFRLQEIYRDSHLEDARADLEKHTAISENRRSGIITITVADKDAGRATAMASEYIDQLNRTAVRMEQAHSREDRIFFQQELSRITEELRSAETKAGAFSAGAMMVDAAGEVQTAICANRQLQGQLSGEQSELQSLRATYADGSAEVRTKVAEIAELKKQSQMLVGSNSSSPAQASEPGVYLPLRGIPALAAQYEDLNRVVEQKEYIAQDLNDSYQNALLQELSDLPLVKVLDPPSVPEGRPWEFSFWIIFFGACAAALSFSAYIVIACEFQQPALEPLDTSQRECETVKA